jgi:hypothetical protein
MNIDEDFDAEFLDAGLENSTRLTSEAIPQSDGTTANDKSGLCAGHITNHQIVIICDWTHLHIHLHEVIK